MIRFLWENKWDATYSSLLISTENAHFPATNTQHRWWQKTWRSTICTDPQFLINDMGPAGDWVTPANSACALRYTNFAKSGAASIKIWAGNTIWGEDHLIDTFGTNNNALMIEYFAAIATEQYWRVNISDATNPDLFHEIGRIFLGAYWSPGRNFAPGGGRIDDEDLSIVSRGEQGHLSALIQTNLKMFRYTFEWMSAADVATIRAMYEMHRTVGGFFFTEDSANPTTTTYYVRFYEKPQYTPEMVGFSTVTITLVESM